MSIERLKSAKAISIPDDSQIDEALQEFGLGTPRPTLVLVGGAGGMTPELIESTMNFFRDRIAPFVIQHGISVVDGGTKSGIMLAMGLARAAHNATFPLLGVAVEKLLRDDPSMVEENHSHLILCPGNDWGDEVPILSRVATLLAGPHPSMTLLFNGGQITWKDAAASVEQKRAVLVAEGSGRAADGISMTQNGTMMDLRAIELIKTGLIRVANPYTKPELFMSYIKQTFKVT